MTTLGSQRLPPLNSPRVSVPSPTQADQRPTPRLRRGLEPTRGPAVSTGAIISAATASGAIAAALGEAWQVRATYRDARVKSLRCPDMWVTLLERTSGRKRWAATLLYNKGEPDSNFLVGSTRWEACPAHTRAELVKRSLTTALSAASPLTLLERFCRGDWRWPAMPRQQASGAYLNDPSMAACTALLKLSGSEGEAMRLIAGLGGYVAVTGTQADRPLEGRVVDYRMRSSFQIYELALKDRIRELGAIAVENNKEPLPDYGPNGRSQYQRALSSFYSSARLRSVRPDADDLVPLDDVLTELDEWYANEPATRLLSLF